jgi:hypothetical protein
MLDGSTLYYKRIFAAACLDDGGLTILGGDSGTTNASSGEALQHRS